MEWRITPALTSSELGKTTEPDIPSRACLVIPLVDLVSLKAYCVLFFPESL